MDENIEKEQRIYVKYRSLLDFPKEDIQNDLVKIHGDAAIKLLTEENNDSEPPTDEQAQPKIKPRTEKRFNSQEEISPDELQEKNRDEKPEEKTPTTLMRNQNANSSNDPDMDAIIQHERLPNTILRHKATVANKNRRMPSFKKNASPTISIKNTNDFFDIQDFLETNPDFSKIKSSISDEDLEVQARERKRDPLTEEMKNSTVLKRYSMPPARSQSYRIPNSFQMQPRVVPRAQTEDNDSSPSILRKKREMQRDESITSISENDATTKPPKPILRNKPTLKSPVVGETNQAPVTNEFISRANRMRQSWDGQSARRIEKLLNNNPSTENPYKRHSVYISNGISNLENKPKPPPPGPKPKSPAKNAKINTQLKAIIPDIPKGKEIEDKVFENPKELQNEIVELKPPKVPNNETVNTSKETTKTDSLDSPKEIPETTFPIKPTPPVGYSKNTSENKDVAQTDDSANSDKNTPKDTVSTPGDQNLGEKPKITRPKPTISRKPRVEKNSRVEVPLKTAKEVKNKVKEDTEIDQKSVEIDTRIEKNSTSSDDDQKKPIINSHENRRMNSSQDEETTSIRCNGQNSNNSNCYSVNKNNHAQTTRGSFRKEKPILAFLKAKEETNQQSFNTGSQLNGAFLSSGITASGINAKDKDNFINSKPIIPQPKIISY